MRVPRKEIRAGQEKGWRGIKRKGNIGETLKAVYT